MGGALKVIILKKDIPGALSALLADPKFPAYIRTKVVYPFIQNHATDKREEKWKATKDPGRLVNMNYVKCWVNKYASIMQQGMMVTLNETKESPWSKPATIIVTRYKKMVVNDRVDKPPKGEKGTEDCVAEFQFDYLYCWQWMEKHECKGALVAKEFTSRLLKSPRDAKCEGWFVIVQGMVAAVVGVVSASMTRTIYGGHNGRGGRYCFYEPHNGPHPPPKWTNSSNYYHPKWGWKKVDRNRRRANNRCASDEEPWAKNGNNPMKYNPIYGKGGDSGGD